MPLANANLTWDPISGSTGYLVEYKLSDSSTWITPSSPSNPTLYPYYTLVIDYNKYYDVRITNYSAKCSPASIVTQILATGTACCPDGYTLSDDGTYCFQQDTTVATPPTSSENTVAKSFNTYSCWGTVIFNPGYTSNGVGAFTTIPTSNSFWINGTGYPGVTGDTTMGPMNRAGLWSTTVADDQIIGFTVCIDIPEDATYLVAVVGDNIPKITLDGNVIVDMDPSALGDYMVAHGYPAMAPYKEECAFRFWNVYPVALKAGTRVLELLCQNVTGIAAMAAEIYNATAGDLIAAHSYSDLGAKLIFSTKDYIGMPVQIGSDGIGYTCPDGYSLVLCDGPAYCKKVTSTPIIEC